MSVLDAETVVLHLLLQDRAGEARVGSFFSQIKLGLESVSKLEVVKSLLPHGALLVVESEVLVQVATHTNPLGLSGPGGTSVWFSISLDKLEVSQSLFELPLVQASHSVLRMAWGGFGSPSRNPFVNDGVVRAAEEGAVGGCCFVKVRGVCW